MKKNKKFLFLFFLIGIIYICQGVFLPKDFGSQSEKFFLIKKGEGLEEISSNLEKEGFIKSKFFFEAYLIFKKEAKNLKAGGYLLSTSMNIPEISRKFVSGEIAKEEITVIEGWNLKDIAGYLEEKGIISSGEFLEITNSDFSKGYDFLNDKPKNLGLEGYLFPDTYLVNRGFVVEEIIRMMLGNFNEKLTPDLREEIYLQKKTIFEIITMASLVEKEVKSAEDKKIVAGILWKRMEEGIPLQVDATIAYITGKKTTKISREETRIDSPYNTYKYKGLPLGPICNPGFESILSSVYYINSEYLYYLSTPEGKTIFSRTLEEHNIAKEKYLK